MKGSYVLLIKALKNISIKIGALGKISFSKGTYAYIGSALNNLEKRVARHKRNEKKLHWHIDYLLKSRNVKVIKVFYKESETRDECCIAKVVAKHGTPVIKFGCSDCICESHLFKMNEFLSELFERMLFQ
jgi:Uri superfamily endonuclease